MLTDYARLDDLEIAKVRTLLKRLMEKAPSDATLESITDDIVNRRVQVWRINNWEALAVTRVNFRPKHNILTVEWLSGAGMRRWIDTFVETMKMYGTMMGCRRIEFTTQRGGWEFWRRRFPDFQPEYVTYCKEI